LNTHTDSAHSLNGAFGRVVRAEQHFSELVGRIETLRQEQHDAIAWEFDLGRPGEVRVSRTKDVLVPLLFSILVGEICYNLRAALDYLVFELAQLDSEQVQNGTQFPIEDSPKNFAGNGQRRLVGLNGRHIAAIEALQAYNGCNWTRRLRDISNPDKHRSLSFAQGGFELEVYPAADRLRFLNLPGKVSSARHPVTGVETHVQTNLTLEIQFSDGTPVIHTLEEIKVRVAATLEAFKADFK
jgi:hypothetical protein